MSDLKTIGLVGLGRMGEAIAHRLIQAGHAVVGFDPDENARTKLDGSGGTASVTIQEVTSCRVIWLMVPAGKIIDNVIEQLLPVLQKNSIIIDGGNSHFTDSIRRAQVLEQQGHTFLDCGTSGGLKGREIGFSLMVGGNEQTYKKIEPIFKAIAAQDGYAHMGPPGAGHYVKMIHNGVEYAILQSYSNGFNLLKNGHYKNLDLHAIAKTWSNGSVIRSWICDLLEEIFENDQEFTNVSGKIAENLTGRWTLEEAEKQNVSMELVESALKTRAWSRETGGNYATKLVALLRNKFGGHDLGKK